ncbi:MAG TPA: prolyl oligopeptidase family serine peptidase, partial [Flavisolibacter sp.]
MARIFMSTMFCLLFFWSAAQQKKLLTTEDYGKWQNLGTTALSANGDWIAYHVTVQEDNDTLFVQNRSTGKVHKLEFAFAPEFSMDNQWIAYRVGLPYKEAEKLRDQSKPIEYKMGLLNLASGKKEEIKNINRFGFSKDGRFLAVYLNAPRESKDKGAVLLVRNLAEGTTRTIGNVTEYAFNKKSDHLAYIVESANTAANSIELFNLKNSTLKVLASDTARFSKITWQKNGDALAFYRSFRKDKYEEDNAVVYLYGNLSKSPALRIFDPEKNSNFPKGMRVFNGSAITVSEDMSSVFFGVKGWTYNELAKKDDRRPGDSLTKKDTARIDSTRAIIAARKGSSPEKLAGVDIWHWKDPEIQPRQKVTLGQDTVSSYLSVWNVDNGTFFQLANAAAPLAQLTGNFRHAVIYTDHKYKPAFKEDYADAFIVDVKTGANKLAFEKTVAGPGAFPRTSPDGRYLLYFKDKNWWTYNVATGQNTNLTEKLGVPFWNIRDDRPGLRPAVGTGGWTKGDREVLLYDEYDVWAVKPDGKGARKLTDGRKDETVYRVNRLDFENPYIDDSKPVFFSAYGDKTKQFGYARMQNGRTERLIFENAHVGRLVKAENANTYLYVKQNYDVSPTLFVSDDLVSAKQVVATNPQQQDYFWGKSELITFTNKAGKKMQGALFYPANYEAGKKYPMVTYIYEILSNTVHNYITPSQRSPYNTTNFTSNGYFVFRPDIVYEINDPGMSAVNNVIPAVEEVLKTGMIDRDKLAIMGHSWGAYQTSFIISQTKMFKAAVAGAPLTNLISMSNSIYWNTGTPDSKIFETSQGRFDGPWYERMEEHMRNSPMYQASKIETPLLVAFGDKDGAV